MGFHVEERSFQPSVTFITTDTKHEPETRIPAVRAHAGAWEEARPGCTVERVMQLERDVAGGKLDTLARRALVDHAAGRTKPL
jgi:hypothetical protein